MCDLYLIVQLNNIKSGVISILHTTWLVKLGLIGWATSPGGFIPQVTLREL